MFNRHTDRPARWELLALAVILLAAAVLRMAAPGVSEFKLDEARLSTLALEMARGRSFPLLGIGSSVGIPNAPVNVWLFAIPYLFTADPTLATLYVGLLNVAAVGLTWWLARRYYGPWAALLAALMYAVSPWGIIYSRKIWAQNLLPPFVLLTLITGCLGFLEDERARRWRWQIAHVALAIFTVLIHFGALVLVPLMGLIVWLGRRNVSRRMWIALVVLALSALLAAAGALLYLQGRGYDFAAFTARPITLTGEALYHFGLTLTGTEIHALAGPEQFENYRVTVPDVTRLQHAFGWITVIAAAGLVIVCIHRGEVYLAPTWIILALMVLPSIVYTLTWTPSFPHYMIPAMPAMYIVFGVGAALAFRWLHGRLRAAQFRAAALVAGASVIAFAALQAWVTVGLFVFLDGHETPGGFGTPLHYLLDVRSAILDQQPDDVLVIGAGHDSNVDEAAAVWGFLLYDVPSVRLLESSSLAVLADDSAASRLALALPGAPIGIGALTSYCQPASITGFPARSSATGEFPRYTVCMRPGIPAEAPEIGLRFASGAQLDAARVFAGDVLLFFSSTGPLPGDYSVFNHILDAEGSRIAQRDGPAWPGRFWRDGEQIAQRFDVPELAAVLDDAVTLRVGMYTFNADGSTAPVDVLDAAGYPAGQWVDLPIADILAGE